MSDGNEDKNRRTFLRWIGAAALGGPLVAGCRDPSGGGGGLLDTGSRDTGSRDTGRRDTGRGADAVLDSSGADTGGGYPTGDTGVPNDTGADTGRSDTGPGDAGDTADAGSCKPTGSDVEGPFFVDGAPQRTQLAPSDEPGTRLDISGTVYGPDCSTPVSGAMLDIWHANDEGDYYDADDNYRLRGQMMTDSQGRYAFDSIRPGNYPLGSQVRPAHIHYAVHAPSFAPLTTQLYFADDPHLAPNDPCSGCNSGDPTLIIELNETTVGGTKVLKGTFDIVLQKE